MRKTTTSSKVKDRWNAKNYDQVQFRVGVGGREIIAELARQNGMSMSAYLRHLVIVDCKTNGNGDISALLGGGGHSSPTALSPSSDSEP